MVIAFAGNPNVGKTALINAISGAKLKIGNWPGVTVEKREAEFEFEGRRFRLVDLPGIYSLTPYTIEERIAQEFLLEERPDVVVNVIDVTNIERNLYLTTQLAELEIPMVIALNMWDEFKSKGFHLDVEMLSQILQVPCVPTAAVRGKGIDRLLKEVIRAYENHILPAKMRFNRVIEEKIERLEEMLKEREIPYPLRWSAIKILEKDEFFLEKVKKFISGMEEEIERMRREIEDYFGEDIETVIAEQRYGYINGLVREVLKKPVERKIEITDLIDKVFLNRLLGMPIFFFLIYMMFKVTFDGSAPLIDWIDGFINGFVGKWLSIGLYGMGAPHWLVSLLIDGVLSGVGLVLSFVPLMFFLYLFMSILEESGYMARAAFLMDKIMHLVGLHGKSFIPMVIGFGCNVPAVLATRVLESEKDRRLTALLIPFMSCGARLPIYALFTGLFFKKHQAEIVFSLYFMGVVVSLIVGMILQKTVFKGESRPFIMELPPYRIPTVKMLWNSIWLRTRSFIKKAGTVIAVTMVILWFFMNIPYGSPPEKTVLGRVARTVSPVFYPLGFGKNWKAIAALIPGTVAKEIVVGALGQLYGLEEEVKTEKADTSFTQDLKQQVLNLKNALIKSLKGIFGGFKTGIFEVEEEKNSALARIKSEFTPLSAFSYMVFCLLWMPCAATLGAIYSEFGAGTLMLSILLTTTVPYSVSAVIYNLGKVMGF
ncbi:MAG: ferrous iron transport protein B [Deferribacteres bacterium]|nr:ferrous iron transport protein B [Deferribacteres bacterium]